MNWGKRMVFAALLGLTPEWAGAWRARNLHEVVPVSETVFEVVGRPGSGPAEYWCGAGDYVRHALSQSATQRVFIWRAIGPSTVRSGRKAVQFSMAAPDSVSVPPRYSLSMKAVGDSLSAAAAFQYCFDNDRDDPIFPWR